MSSNYLSLPDNEQRQLIADIAKISGKSDYILEKDIWLCLTLRELFKLPHPMTFKGGTSLSKVFNLIHRFSEDVDVTLDYRHFNKELDLSQPLSKSALKKISETLRKSVKEYTHGTVLSHMQKAFEEHIPDKKIDITISEDGEKMFIYYPSLFQHDQAYVRRMILVEFGGRNTTEPSQLHKVTPMLGNFTQNIVLPEAEVQVLSPVRTFWEKATLMHVRNHKGKMDDAPDRLSRHWYDMAMMSDTWVIKEALSNRQLMENVIKHNIAFYHAGYARYEDCLAGNFLLLPEQQWIGELKKDYEKMIEAGMFESIPPSFDELLTKIRTVQVTINNAMQQVESIAPEQKLNKPWFATIEKNEIEILRASDSKVMSQIGNFLYELQQTRDNKQIESLLNGLIKSVLKDPVHGTTLEKTAPALFKVAKVFVERQAKENSYSR